MRELSINLFKDALKSMVGRKKRMMKKTVQRVLLPLFLHINDENESVAKVR